MSANVKSIFYNLLLLFTVSLFTNCSKKSNPAPKPASLSELIVGRWQITSDTLKQIYNGVLTVSPPPALPTDYKVFNGDGTGGETLRGNFYYFTYSVYTTFIENENRNILSINFPAQTVAGTTLFAQNWSYLIKNITTTNLQIIYDVISSDSDGNHSEYIETDNLIKVN